MTKVKNPDKRGLYHCEFHCRPSPKFPAPTWKTLAGYEKHLKSCPKRPEAIAARLNEQEQRESVRRAKIAACPRRVGESVFVIFRRVTRPTHVWRGSRQVRMYYEELYAFDAMSATIQEINWLGDDQFGYYQYRDLYGYFSEGDVYNSLEEAKQVAAQKLAGHQEAVRNAEMCR